MACSRDGCTSPAHMVQANGLCVMCNKVETGHALRQPSKRLDRETFFDSGPSPFVHTVDTSASESGPRNSTMELSGILWKGKRTGLLARFTLRKRFFLLKGRRVQYFKDERDFKGGKVPLSLRAVLGRALPTVACVQFGPCNPKGSFDVTECMQRNDLKGVAGKHGFQVKSQLSPINTLSCVLALIGDCDKLITPKREYLLWSKTEDDKGRWCEVPTEHFPISSIPSRACLVLPAGRVTEIQPR